MREPDLRVTKCGRGRTGGGRAGITFPMPLDEAAPQQPSGRPATWSDLDAEAEDVTVAVMTASRLLIAVSARALSSIDEAVTLPQLRALVVLESCEPLKLAALATTLGVNPSTAMRMVDKLEGVGLVDRRANPDNRREVVLRLTPAGRDVVEQVLAHRRAEIRTLVGRLPAEQREGLVPALQALIQAAGELAVDPVHEVRLTGGLVPNPLAPGGRDGLG
ncbi:putative MarR-family transcriptional regulator [Streptomyces noursei]|uniref:Putative MarR-family transcriptional regulator n=2 Tax=Streptomyces noursei TaxID=1971 RepID=A0A401QQC7_STRNR|nr:putative MarR-family transcriptional regulator [Streptomyces noursei]